MNTDIMQYHGSRRRSVSPSERSTRVTDGIALIVLAVATSGLVVIAIAFLP